MRIAFMGTPDFSVPALTRLIEAGHDIAAVYTQPPRPAGRGKKLKKSAVHKAAENLGLPVFTPVSLKAEDEQRAFSELNLECTVVVAYGLLLPAIILEAPAFGCLNIHASILPRWRGAAPIHRAIMAGDKNTGVTIMQMDEGLDTGDVLLKSEIIIDRSDTTLSLHDRLSGLGSSMIVEALEGLEAGSLKPEPQPDRGVTYAKKIEKAEARVNWLEDAAGIERNIRGLYPFPGAWTELDGDRLKILAAKVEAHEGEAATALDDDLLIACGHGSLRLLKVQKAGKGPVTSEQFLQGQPVKAGHKFGSDT